MSSFRTQSLDTTPEAERVLVEIWRRMPSWEKAELVRRLVRACHALTMAGVRQRRPGASEEEIRIEARRLWQEDAFPPPPAGAASQGSEG